MRNPARMNAARKKPAPSPHPRRVLPTVSARRVLPTVSARRVLPAVAALAAALLVGGAAPATAGPATPGGPVTADLSRCGSPPGELPAGPVAFQVGNATRDFAAVYLIDPGGSVYAEIRSLPPGLTGPLAATLAPGRYALRCVFSNGAVLTSSSYTVTGQAPADATAGVRPLPDLEMEGPVHAYRAYVGAALPGLLAASRSLDADVARGDLAAARGDWLTAHLDYERLGAAYNAFGDFDGELDGTAQGQPQGPRTPGWTGFFAVEYGLWHGDAAAQLRPLTTGLASDVQGLIEDFPSEDIDPGDLPLRAHEILENALQFQLTGGADYGSGTGLATIYANTQGTAAVLGTLRPLIQAREPALLAAIDLWLGRVQTQLTALRSPDGTWTSPGALGTAQRQRLDGYLGELLEQLSAVPDLLAPRTSA
jgi:iron uptake system EfeUOB component EfeO/EfeM